MATLETNANARDNPGCVQWLTELSQPDNMVKHQNI